MKERTTGHLLDLVSAVPSVITLATVSVKRQEKKPDHSGQVSEGEESELMVPWESWS